MAMKFCPDCGTRLVEGANFCPECGKSITPAVKPEETVKIEETVAAEPVKTVEEPVKTVEEPVKTVEVAEPVKTEEPSAPAADVNAVKPPCPPNHLVKAIVFTCIFCFPFGIPAIVNAAQVATAYAAGDYELAEQRSKNAAKWSKKCLIWGIVFYAVAYVLYLAIIVAGAL